MKDNKMSLVIYITIILSNKIAIGICIKTIVYT